MEDQIIFKVFMASNPISGAPLYEEITKKEINEYFGVSWEDLTDNEKDEIINCYN